MDLGVSGVVSGRAGACGAPLSATVLTSVSVVWNGPGGCENWRIFFWNHATF